MSICFYELPDGLLHLGGSLRPGAEPMNGGAVGFEPVGLPPHKLAGEAFHLNNGLVQGDFALQIGNHLPVPDGGEGRQVGGVAP